MSWCTVALPGVVSIPKNLKKDELVGIYTQKGEIVGLGTSLLAFDDFFKQKKGISFQIKRMVMKPNTYPKFWSSSDTVISTAEEASDNLIKEEDDSGN